MLLIVHGESSSEYLSRPTTSRVTKSNSLSRLHICILFVSQEKNRGSSETARPTSARCLFPVFREETTNKKRSVCSSCSITSERITGAVAENELPRHLMTLRDPKSRQKLAKIETWYAIVTLWPPRQSTGNGRMDHRKNDDQIQMGEPSQAHSFGRDSHSGLFAAARHGNRPYRPPRRSRRWR